MTLFRQVAARRGVVIAAIGPAKWKTAFQSIWVGCGVLLVLRRDARREPRTGRRHRVARVRDLQRHRRRRDDDRRRRAHAVFARALPARYGARLHRSARPRPELTCDGAPTAHAHACTSKSSPSATSCCSASRSTPTPRISRASSPRSASQIVRRTTVGDNADGDRDRGARSARPHRRGDHDRRPRTHERRPHQAVHRRAVRPRDGARRGASRVDGGALAQTLPAADAGGEPAAGDASRGRAQAHEQSRLGARASGSRTSVAAGWRCCPAFRARCAACSPTRCCR